MGTLLAEARVSAALFSVCLRGRVGCDWFAPSLPAVIGESLYNLQHWSLNEPRVRRSTSFTCIGRC